MRVLIATVVVAAIVLAGGLAWRFTTKNGEPSPNGLSFYMEYTIERTGAPLDVHNQLPTIVAGRWWYEAPNKSRYESDAFDPLLGEMAYARAIDGHVATLYDGATNTYRTTPVAPTIDRHPLGSGPLSPTWASIPVGPLGFASVDEALQRLAQSSTVTRRGEETVIGREADVYVIERTAAPLPDGMPARARETYWIEPQPLAILKAVAESTDGTWLTIVATKLEYRRSIDDDTFTVKQPAGSLDVSATPMPSSSQMGESTVPAPFLTATYLPEGFRWRASRGSPSLAHTQEFRSEGGGYLRVDQRYRYGGWPQNVPVPGKQMLYAAGDVWVVQDAAPLVLLGMRGDIIVRIEADSVQYEEAVGVLFGVR